MPLISVITPTYNCAAKVETTIQSVLSQQTDLFEYIIMDGGSTDGTVEILKKYDSRLNYLSEKDNGIYDAMNKGIDRASGKYFYFLGAGDCLRPGIFAEMAKILPKESLSFVYGNVWWVNLGKIHDGKFTKVKFTRGCINHQAIFYERSIFERMGKYDIQYNIAADYILNIRCFGDNKIKKIHIDKIIADYEGGGISDTANDPNFYRNVGDIIKNNLGPIPYMMYKFETLLPPGWKQGRYHAMQTVRRVLAK